MLEAPGVVEDAVMDLEEELIKCADSSNQDLSSKFSVKNPLVDVPW
jgi:hypothetical protein